MGTGSQKKWGKDKEYTLGGVLPRTLLGATISLRVQSRVSVLNTTCVSR